VSFVQVEVFVPPLNIADPADGDPWDNIVTRIADLDGVVRVWDREVLGDGLCAAGELERLLYAKEDTPPDPALKTDCPVTAVCPGNRAQIGKDSKGSYALIPYQQMRVGEAPQVCCQSHVLVAVRYLGCNNYPDGFMLLELQPSNTCRSLV
jgi:hypothetical protein